MHDSNSPATKADLIALEERFNNGLIALKERLTEKWRDMQTELLKAFYGVIESNQKRFYDLERESAGLKDRFATLESRLTEVKRRLNLPPAA
jgi:hypothetical protein